MIKIELQFETGAEAREALEQLLGFSGQNIHNYVGEIKNPIKDEKIAENFEAPKLEVVPDEKPVEKTKRRNKAEIEAEKTAAPAQDEKLAEEQSETQEEAKVAAVTKEMLQEKAVNLIRNNKKPEVVATLKKFDADSIAQADKNPLKVEDYPAVMDELNKL